MQHASSLPHQPTAAGGGNWSQSYIPVSESTSFPGRTNRIRTGGLPSDTCHSYPAVLCTYTGGLDSETEWQDKTSMKDNAVIPWKLSILQYCKTSLKISWLFDSTDTCWLSASSCMVNIHDTQSKKKRKKTVNPVQIEQTTVLTLPMTAWYY